MPDLKDLAKQMETMADEVPLVVNNLSKECAEIILTDLLQVTPVDTSQAISNWQVSLDVPITEPIPAYYPGAKGSTQIPSQQAALEVGLEVLRQKKAGQTIYITNALPYIWDLNAGSSNQEPAAFVERAALLGRLFAEDPASFGKL